MQLDPTDKDYEAAAAIARDNYATQLAQRALTARTQGDDAGFHALMLQAVAQDSRNPLVVEHREEIFGPPEPHKERPETLQDDAAPPVVLQPRAETHSFHLHTSQKQVIEQVLSQYGILATVDSSIGSDSIFFNADDITYGQALRMLTLATDSFLVPLDPHRALVSLDTKVLRDKYERLVVETLYLPGLSSNEMDDVGNIARNIFQAQQVTLNHTAGTISVRAAQRRLDAFNYEMKELLDGHSEVSLHIDMYEVQRQYEMNVGAQLPQSSTIFDVNSEIQNLLNSNQSLVQQIISSGLANSGNLEEIALALIASGQAAGSSLLSNPFTVVGGGLTLTGFTINAGNINALLTDAKTQMVNSVDLRLEDQQEGTIKVGERYPIVTSSYSNLVTGSNSIAGITSPGVSTALQNLGLNSSSLSAAASGAVPQVQYQDIGMEFTATPRVEADGFVSMKVHFALSSLSGQMLNGNPVINNRASDSILSIRPNEQAVMMSQVSNQEVHSLVGYPFISEIPGFPDATNRDITKTQDSIVIIITPHILRLTHPGRAGGMFLLPTHS